MVTGNQRTGCSCDPNSRRKNRKKRWSRIASRYDSFEKHRRGRNNSSYGIRK